MTQLKTGIEKPGSCGFRAFCYGRFVSLANMIVPEHMKKVKFYDTARVHFTP